MEHAEMVALIHGGVGRTGGVWADMGAGTGNFTWALAELLGAAATIYAVDRDGKAIAAQMARLVREGAGATIVPRQADFSQPLTLPTLDGLLMANALHFVREQAAVLARLVGHIAPGGRLLVVEYEVQGDLRYVPYPIPYTRFVALTEGLGLSAPTRVGTRLSRTTGVAMYAAVADVV